ncbi:MAG TPA: M48 family metallopeptidase [Steroidobacteraceae bacterium]|jgi:STE24 endopeptidase
MHPFTALFLSLLVAGLALQLWLLRRQARAVLAHRERVPAAFRDAVTQAQHARAADYTVARANHAARQLLVGAAMLALLTVGGGIAAIDAGVRAVVPGGLAGPVAVVAATALVTMLVNLPFDAWAVFGIEARFGFNRTTPALFLVDLLKGLAISAALFLPVVALLVWLLPHAGPRWWLWAFAGWAVLTVSLGWAWPRLIAPLFNRFHELEAGELRDAVEGLARHCGFEPRGVRVMDGSRRSTHGNAYFTGFGRGKRIVLFDTLLATLATAEVTAVLAHELGHFRLRHVAWRIVRSLAGAFAGFALLAWLARQAWFQPALGVPAGGPHTLLLLFALAAPVFLQPVGPVAAWLSRRHEFAADAYAARHASARDLASALVKLHRENAATLTPDPVFTAFHATHPPALDRIARLTAPKSP